jgi:hypothetical protein
MDTEIMVARPDIIMKQKRYNMRHTDKCGNASGEEYHAKGKGQSIKYKPF